MGFNYEYYRKASIEDAATDLGNELYEVLSKVFEAQEHAHNIQGNGHHMAQEVVAFARDILLKNKV